MLKLKTTLIFRQICIPAHVLCIYERVCFINFNIKQIIKMSSISFRFYFFNISAMLKDISLQQQQNNSVKTLKIFV